MDWKKIYFYIKDNPEWFILGLVIILLIGGGSGYYYHTRQQEEARVRQQFNRVFFFYSRAEDPGQFEQVSQQLNHLLGQYPHTEMRDKILYFLGKSHYRREEYERAIQHFLEVARNFPDSIFYESSRLHAGYCYYQLGRTSEALNQFGRLETLDPGDPAYQEALWQQGLILWEQQEHEKAREVLDRLVETAPEADSYWLRRARGLLAEISA